jgi:tight adherence protein B
MRTPTWTYFAAGFGITIAIAILYGIIQGLRRRKQADTGAEANIRLQYYLDKRDDADELPLRSGKRTLGSLRPRLHRIEQRLPVLRGFARELVNADIYLYPYEWLALVILASAVISAAFCIFFSSLLGILGGAIAGYIGGGAIIRYRQRARLRAFDAQLGDALSLLGSGLQSGFSFEQAMSSVAQDGLPPLQQEFQRYCKEIALGVPVDSALMNLIARNPSFDLRIAVNAIQIHRQIGGNLSGILEQIEETIRERVNLRQEVRTLTAQARLSGYIVAFIPVALMLILNVINPQYVHNMLTNGLGIAILIACGVSITVAGILIQRIVNISL